MNENQYDFSSEVIYAFTEGDCWALALSLNRMTGWPLIFLGREEWVHVLVKTPNGKWLDIHGENTPKQIRKYWCEDDWFAETNRADAQLLIESDGLGGRWFTDHHPDDYAKRLLDKLPYTV